MILFGPAIAPLAANMAKTVSWRKIEAGNEIASIEKAVTLDSERDSRRDQSLYKDETTPEHGQDAPLLTSYSAEGSQRTSEANSGRLDIVA
jgi:hypothetical protein